KGFLAFFQFVDEGFLWITSERIRTPLQQHLQARRQRAPVEERVLGDFLERVTPDELHGLARMRECLADQAEVLGVKLHGLEGSERLIVQDVEVALKSSGARIAPTPHEAEPPCQTQ